MTFWLVSMRAILSRLPRLRPVSTAWFVVDANRSWPLADCRWLKTVKLCVKTFSVTVLLQLMENSASETDRNQVCTRTSRRMFLRAALAGGASVLMGRGATLFAAAPSTDDTGFTIGGDLPVHRLGFGAMRLAGEGIWGWPPDRQNALNVLRRAVELGVNLID